MPIPNGVDLAKCSMCCEGVLVRSVGHFRCLSWCGRDGQWRKKCAKPLSEVTAKVYPDTTPGLTSLVD
jgi:hypothetical protein